MQVCFVFVTGVFADGVAQIEFKQDCFSLLSSLRMHG